VRDLSARSGAMFYDPCRLARQVKQVEWLGGKPTANDPCRLARQVKQVESSITAV